MVNFLHTQGWRNAVAIYVRPLTEAEMTALRKALRSPNAHGQRRARVILWSSQKHKAPAIAQRLVVHDHTVRRCLKAFNQEGLSSLYPTPQPGPPLSFDDRVADSLIHILHQPPTTYGLGTAVWTLKDAKKVAEGIGLVDSIAKESIRQILRRKGHSWKRAKGWIVSPDPNYLARKKEARPVGEEGAHGARYRRGCMRTKPG